MCSNLYLITYWFIGYVTLGKLPHISELQFFILYNLWMIMCVFSQLVIKEVKELNLNVSEVVDS